MAAGFIRSRARRATRVGVGGLAKFAAVSAVSVAGLGIALGILFERQADARLVRQALETTELVGSLARGVDIVPSEQRRFDDVRFQAVQRALAAETPVTALVLWNGRGGTFYASDTRVLEGEFPGEGALGRALHRREPGYRRVGDTLRVYVPLPASVEPGAPSVLQLDYSYKPILAQLAAEKRRTYIVLAVALVLLWISLFPIVARMLAERARAEEARRRSEEQLRQAQKMEAVGQLAGGIAHDFNNLLLAINGYSELAHRRLNGGEPAVREAIDEVRAAGDRAASLTRQLLAFSRRQVLQSREIVLNDVIENLTRMLRRLLGGHLELELSLDPAAGRIVADPSQVEQVLMNLTLNARDAMPDGGRLRIETGRRRVAAVGGELPPGDWVTLTVADTGTGMDEETLKHAFEPFFTTKEPGKGTGLGLATVYGVVEQSGGRVAVASEQGRGTTFMIALPAAPAAAVQPVEAPEETVPAGGGTVLLVEDDAVVRRFVREALELHGYAVTEAADASVALELAEQRHFDLVLTDIVMPEMNGRQLAERVSQVRPQARILLTSGYPRDPVDVEAEFLQKPYTVDELVRKVHDVLAA
jgi:signal transduction histidine kinase/CheY-like chemotaxis protein